MPIFRCEPDVSLSLVLPPKYHNVRQLVLRDQPAVHVAVEQIAHWPHAALHRLLSHLVAAVANANLPEPHLR
jgi:hypothetical protein